MTSDGEELPKPEFPEECICNGFAPRSEFSKKIAWRSFCGNPSDFSTKSCGVRSVSGILGTGGLGRLDADEEELAENKEVKILSRRWSFWEVGR